MHRVHGHKLKFLLLLFSYCKMKAGVWYVCGFVIAFVYFYVYAVNYIRGVRADSVPIQNIKSFNEFHERVTRQINRDPLRTIPASRQHIALRRADKGGQPRFQQPIHPRYKFHLAVSNYVIYDFAIVSHNSQCVTHTKAHLM